MIKVIITDDQPVLCDGIKAVLTSSKEIEVIDICYDGEQLLKSIEKVVPDVVLLDIRMPKMNGVIATREIKQKYPNIKVIILTTFDDSDYILDAINYGASGYLLKDTSSKSLIDAVINATKGELILPTSIAKKIVGAAKMVSSDKEIKLKKAFGLSDRETEIAIMVYENFNNRQISSALDLTQGTTRNYISVIYEKIGAENRQVAIEKMSEVLKQVL